MGDCVVADRCGWKNGRHVDVNNAFNVWKRTSLKLRSATGAVGRPAACLVRISDARISCIQITIAGGRRSVGRFSFVLQVYAEIRAVGLPLFNRKNVRQSLIATRNYSTTYYNYRAPKREENAAPCTVGYILRMA